MTPNEYQTKASRTLPPNYDTLKHLIMAIETQDIIHAKLGIDSESGELADAIKKWLIYGKELDRENIKEECGDILWYISLMLRACKFTMEDCMVENIEKLKKRYPEKFI